MSVPVITRHDHGCKWSRFDGQVDEQANIVSGEVRPGHSDAARRFSDGYNLHRAAGTHGGWIAVALADGDCGADVYDTRQEAVSFAWPYEDRYFFAVLAQPSMTICQAESLLRYKRVMNEMESAHADRDAPGGGLEVIERMSVEDMEAQITAVRTGRGMLALGRRTSRRTI